MGSDKWAPLSAKMGYHCLVVQSQDSEDQRNKETFSRENKVSGNIDFKKYIILKGQYRQFAKCGSTITSKVGGMIICDMSIKI